MKHLEDLALAYANKNYPIFKECDELDIIRHNIAKYSFADGFNEAMRILMDIGNIKELDERINKYNYIEVE